MENKYNEQAEKFLKDTNTEFKAEFLKNGLHFEGDTEPRDIYKITLKRDNRVYNFNFGQSINKSSFKLINTNTGIENRCTWFNEMTYNKDRNRDKLLKDILKIFGNLGCFKLVTGTPPTSYDVLSCLQKNEVGSFEDFCCDFGYETDSKKAEKTYKAVLEEWQNVQILWNDEEIELLGEIQ